MTQKARSLSVFLYNNALRVIIRVIEARYVAENPKATFSLFSSHLSARHETLGNLSHLPESLIEIIRRSLRGETFVSLGEAFEVISSRPHGHVQAVALAMQRLVLALLLASSPAASAT